MREHCLCLTRTVHGRHPQLRQPRKLRHGDIWLRAKRLLYRCWQCILSWSHHVAGSQKELRTQRAMRCDATLHLLVDRQKKSLNVERAPSRFFTPECWQFDNDAGYRICGGGKGMDSLKSYFSITTLVTHPPSSRSISRSIVLCLHHPSTPTCSSSVEKSFSSSSP